MNRVPTSVFIGTLLTLMIDGEAKPAEVEVGKENFKPNEHPVRARLKP